MSVKKSPKTAQNDFGISGLSPYLLSEIIAQVPVGSDEYCRAQEALSNRKPIIIEIPDTPAQKMAYAYRCF